jgi:predicted O-methyltransferase YrrM
VKSLLLKSTHRSNSSRIEISKVAIRAIAAGNAKNNGSKVSLFKKKSYQALAEMIGHRTVFDFIYVDGSHAPSDALSDACMAWGMLKPKGVMLFDDYQYPHEPTKVGINAFLAGFEGRYEVVLQNYQLAVMKK